MRRAGAGICTSRATGANRASEAGWEPRSRVLPKGRRRNKKEAGHAARADTDPQPRKVRAVPAAGQFPLARDERYHSFRNVGPKGRNRNLKERNCSFRSEGPKGRNRKARCSSGWNDPARPTADRTVSTRSGKAQIQEVLLRIKTRKIFFCSRLFVCFPKRIKLRVGYRPAPRHGACASPLRARARRSQAAAPHLHSQAPLCPAAVFASRASLLTGRAGDAFPSVGTRTGRLGPATKPHACTGLSALP